MIKQNTYICKKCGHSTVSAGRRVNGIMTVTAPYSCAACTEVTDIIIGTYGEEYVNLPAYIPLTELDKVLFDAAYTCDNCGSDKVTKWPERRRPCPKCAGKMYKKRSVVLPSEQDPNT